MCEEEFKDRYTENDEDFMKVKQAVIKNPPIVDDNYDNRSQRFNNRSHQDRDRHNQNWQRHGYDRNRGRDNYRDRERGRSNYNRGGYHQQGYRF